jgi:CRISPR system Cascade subunit CasD
MKSLILRFDAPMLSFGGTVVDANSVTDDMPSRSMITGLLANALGYDYRDIDLLGRLQERLRVAARRDVPGTRIVDFQTVDLGQEFLSGGWTTSGRAEGREGGSAGSGTHIRYRHYIADAIYTVAVTLEHSEEAPTLEMLDAALAEPARPLFIGRKACLPSTPISRGIVHVSSLLDALREAPLGRRGRLKRDDSGVPRKCLVRVPRGGGAAEIDWAERAITEDRDWPNQIHVGRSIVLEAFVECGQSQMGGRT